jgi:hypothetical protein
MSATRPSKQAGRPRWLNPAQQRAWLAYIRVQLRMNYEMRRQSLADSGLSLSDYHILGRAEQCPKRADAGYRSD